jgi:hypothetical protein
MRRTLRGPTEHGDRISARCRMWSRSLLSRRAARPSRFVMWAMSWVSTCRPGDVSSPAHTTMHVDFDQLPAHQAARRARSCFRTAAGCTEGMSATSVTV